MEYWIDGYNVIGQTRLGVGCSLEEARDRLVHALRGLSAPVRIYFDASKSGAPSKPYPPPEPVGSVRQEFVRQGTADDAMILDLRTANQKNVTLVTNDRELRGKARQLGATTLGVEKFIERLTVAMAPKSPPPSASKSSSAQKSEKPGSISKAEVEEWMKLFGFDENGAPKEPL